MLTDDALPTAGRRYRSSRTWAPTQPQGARVEARPVRERKRATAALPGEGEQTLSQLLIDAFIGEVAVLDPGGRVIAASMDWRSRAQRRNKADGQSLGKDQLGFLSSDDSTARKIAASIADILFRGTSEATLNFTALEGSIRRHYRLRASGLGQGPLRGAIVVNEDVTEIYDLHRDKRLLTEQLMQSEEKERRRIAREMHDSTLQDLVAIGLNLKRLGHLAKDEVAQDVLSEVRSILSRTQQDVRTLSYLLHPPLLDEGGLQLALSALVRGLTSRMNIEIDFVCDCCADDVRLPIIVEVALYRVAQEALINVHKHALATHAWVRCSRESDQLVLTIEDDGIGFCGTNSDLGAGVGIQGMRARLGQLGGKLTLSNLRQGTRLKAFVPLDVAGLV